MCACITKKIASCTTQGSTHNSTDLDYFDRARHSAGKETTFFPFLDLSTAFDTPNHNIILDKLRFYEITSKKFHFLKSYLNNRTQYDDYGRAASDIKQKTTGVRQRLFQCPLLFIISNNDISNTSIFLKLFFMQMIVL